MAGRDRRSSWYGARWWRRLGRWLSAAVWGLIFGLLGHAATGGRRDFSSVQGLEASSYEILVEAEYVEAATAISTAARGRAHQAARRAARNSVA